MAPTSLFILNEEAIGYTLFKVKEFEEIGLIQKQVDRSLMSDVSRFNSIVSLAAFLPFTNRATALENMASISEGNVHPDLKNFLEANVPASTKKMNVALGVSHIKLAASISETLEITCQVTGVVPEILKGIKLNIKDLVKGVTKASLNTSRMGVGHAYAGCKVKFNVHKVDNMVTQSVNLLDQVDKNLNMLSMRIRESYANHFPELHGIITDNANYIKAVNIIGDRKTLDDAKFVQLEELLMDSSKIESIKAAAKISMGFDISIVDWSFIEKMTKYTVSHTDFRAKQGEYLKDKMNVIAPNLSTLIGELVGARLIAKAKSIVDLCSLPASTVQILGAEKALFRALKTKGNTPKYGLIYHSTFIGKAPTKHKGRISRFLANKCVIASRIDAFHDSPTTIYGEALKRQVEKRLKFYEDGEIPQPNADVMAEAYEKVDKMVKKMEKKKRKHADASMNESALNNTTVNESMNASALNESALEPKKKKKKANHDNELDESTTEPEKKKKKKDKKEAEEGVAMETSVVEEDKPKKKKKAKEEEEEVAMETSVVEEDKPKKKKKAKEEEEEVAIDTSVIEEKPKKKKKAKEEEAVEPMETSVVEDDKPKKKKDKKAKQDEVEVKVEEVVEEDGEKKKKKKKRSSVPGN